MFFLYRYGVNLIDHLQTKRTSTEALWTSLLDKLKGGKTSRQCVVLHLCGGPKFENHGLNFLTIGSFQTTLINT